MRVRCAISARNLDDETMAPLLAKSGMAIWAGLDLGLKHNATALVECGWAATAYASLHIRCSCRGPETLDIETTAEAAITSPRSRFMLASVFLDPWQGIGLWQRLQRAGIKTAIAAEPVADGRQPARVDQAPADRVLPERRAAAGGREVCGDRKREGLEAWQI